MPRLAAFEGRLRSVAGEPCPVLVVRLPELERVAWRRGLRAARALERRAAAAFSTAVARVLRSDDLVAHDPGSDVFVAALVAPHRDGQGFTVPIDVRSALARIAATVEATTRLDARTGWTTYGPAADLGAFDAVIERALIRGAQERERYAFFSSLGHELRTPLSSIRGYLETLLDPQIDVETRARFVRIAYNESLRLGRLVDGMFEISLLDLHANFTGPAVGALRAAVDGARDACAAAAAKRAVTLEIAVVPALRVGIDTDRLTLVLVNVIDNAVKHGRVGGRVELSVVACERSVRIVVDDDGPGVPPEDRERIFAVGERGPTAAGGNGIGLALARLMIERSGGRIQLASSHLGGACVTVTVLRAAPDDASAFPER